MPDLGSYAIEVLLSYAGTVLLLGVLVWLSARRSVQIKRMLDDTEQRSRDG